MRRILVGVVAFAVSLSTFSVAGAVESSGDGASGQEAPASRTSESGEAVASRRAAETGEPVEIAEQTTETVRAFALPDGTVRHEINALPARVKTSQGWQASDQRLVFDERGFVRPAAWPGDVRLNGGGQGSLFDVAAADATDRGRVRGGLAGVANWPRPQLIDQAAVYRDVTPGVDVVVTFTAGDLVQHVVQRGIAAREELRMDLRSDTAGAALQAEGADQAAVAATLTDSKGAVLARVAGVAKADVSGAGARGRWRVSDDVVELLDSLSSSKDQPVAVASEGGQVVAAAPSAPVVGRLNDGQGRVWRTRFDSFGRMSWGRLGTLRDGRPVSDIFMRPVTTHELAKAGYEAQDGSRWRSFFNMDTHWVKHRRIHSAVFRIEMHNQWSCNKLNTDLHASNTIQPYHTWHRPPQLNGFLGQFNGDYPGCTPRNDHVWREVGGDRLRDYVQVVAANGWDELGLMIQAADEGNTDNWRKFYNNPMLDLRSDGLPWVDDWSMNTDPGGPCEETLSGTHDVRFRHKPGDPDPDAGDINGDFQIWREGQDPERALIRHVTVPSGAEAQWRRGPDTVDGPLGDGVWFWRVRTWSNGELTRWSRTCKVIVDTRMPQAKAEISSEQFPPGTTGKSMPPGTLGHFKIDAMGAGEVDRFAVWVDGEQRPDVFTDKPGGVAWVQWAPTSVGHHVVKVFPKSRTNKSSQWYVTYDFMIGPPVFDVKKGIAAHDVTGDGRPDVVGIPRSGPGAGRWCVMAGSGDPRSVVADPKTCVGQGVRPVVHAAVGPVTIQQVDATSGLEVSKPQPGAVGMPTNSVLSIDATGQVWMHRLNAGGAKANERLVQFLPSGGGKPQNLPAGLFKQLIPVGSGGVTGGVVHSTWLGVGEAGRVYALGFDAAGFIVHDPLAYQIQGSFSGVTFVGGAELTGDGIPDMVARKADGSLFVMQGVQVDAAGMSFMLSKLWLDAGSGFGQFEKLFLGGDLDSDGFVDMVGVDSAGALQVWKGRKPNIDTQGRMKGWIGAWQLPLPAGGHGSVWGSVGWASLQ